MAMKEAVQGGEISNPRGLPITSSFQVNPADNITGYKSFQVGNFSIRREEYFAHIVTRRARMSCRLTSLAA